MSPLESKCLYKCEKNIFFQLYDLYRVFHADEKDGKPGYECMKYLFLGNYVDRYYILLDHFYHSPVTKFHKKNTMA